MEPNKNGGLCQCFSKGSIFRFQPLVFGAIIEPCTNYEPRTSLWKNDVFYVLSFSDHHSCRSVLLRDEDRANGLPSLKVIASYP